MTIKILLATLLVVLFVSCNDHRPSENPKQETPAALKDNNDSYDIISKRKYDDIIDGLYAELLEKDSSLKRIEDKIKDLNKYKIDSAESYDNYSGKNAAYFSAADKHIAAIADTVLRENMRHLVANELTQYNTLRAKHQELLKIIERNQLSITDLHTVLKIVRTLPLIEKYQREALPATKPLEGILQHQEQVIKMADSASKE